MKKEKLTFTQLSPKTLLTHNIIFIYKDHVPTWGGKPRRESESMKYAYDPSVCVCVGDQRSPEADWRANLDYMVSSRPVRDIV